MLHLASEDGEDDSATSGAATERLKSTGSERRPSGQLAKEGRCQGRVTWRHVAPGNASGRPLFELAPNNVGGGSLRAGPNAYRRENPESTSPPATTMGAPTTPSTTCYRGWRGDQ